MSFEERVDEEFKYYISAYQGADTWEDADRIIQELKTALLAAHQQDIERIIGNGSEMIFSDNVPIFFTLEEYMEHVALIREVQRAEQRKRAALSPTTEEAPLAQSYPHSRWNKDLNEWQYSVDGANWFNPSNSTPEEGE